MEMNVFRNNSEPRSRKLAFVCWLINYRGIITPIAKPGTRLPKWSAINNYISLIHHQRVGKIKHMADQLYLLVF
jgi:hypothetical protein